LKESKSSFSGCWVIINFVIFFVLKSPKIYLGPTLPPGNRKWQLNYPNSRKETWAWKSKFCFKYLSFGRQPKFKFEIATGYVCWMCKQTLMENKKELNSVPVWVHSLKEFAFQRWNFSPSSNQFRAGGSNTNIHGTGTIKLLWQLSILLYHWV